MCPAEKIENSVGSNKAVVSDYQLIKRSIYFASLTLVNELWVMTERIIVDAFFFCNDFLHREGGIRLMLWNLEQTQSGVAAPSHQKQLVQAVWASHQDSQGPLFGGFPWQVPLERRLFQTPYVNVTYLRFLCCLLVHFLSMLDQFLKKQTFLVLKIFLFIPIVSLLKSTWSREKKKNSLSAQSSFNQKYSISLSRLYFLLML